MIARRFVDAKGKRLASITVSTWELACADQGPDGARPRGVLALPFLPPSSEVKTRRYRLWWDASAQEYQVQAQDTPVIVLAGFNRTCFEAAAEIEPEFCFVQELRNVLFGIGRRKGGAMLPLEVDRGSLT